jgi:hypothetical protein
MREMNGRGMWGGQQMVTATDNTQQDLSKGLTQNAGSVTPVTRLSLSHLARFSTVHQVRILIPIQLSSNF